MLRMDSHNKQAGTKGHMSHCPAMVPLELVRIHLHACVSAATCLPTEIFGHTINWKTGEAEW